MMTPEPYRPSPRYRTQLVVGILLIFLLCFAPWALLALVPEIGVTFLYWYLGANALWIVLALLWVGPYVRSITYELGDHELIVRRGIVTKSTDMVPYHMVTNVALRRGPIARALGLGTLRVHTAGYSQSSSAEATVNGVADYEELREALILRMRAAERSAGRAAGAETEASAEAEKGFVDRAIAGAARRASRSAGAFYSQGVTTRLCAGYTC